MSIVEIKNVSFSYDKQKVLENINLTVHEKDFLAIIGPNGGGKSTLLKLILGINPLQTGEITIYNQLPSKNLSHIGYVPQNTNINTNFPIRVIDVVMMGHVNHGKKQTLKWWQNCSTLVIPKRILVVRWGHWLKLGWKNLQIKR
jgi:zinc transport system ATP-binding protein